MLFIYVIIISMVNLTSFTLKLIGIVSMLLDHIGKVFLPDQIWLQCLGRLAFPIFAFGVAEGYLHTRNVKKYAIRLTIFAIISQAPYALFRIAAGNDPTNLNILFTLLLGLIAIYVYDKLPIKGLGLILAL